jgi:hypothetical protein
MANNNRPTTSQNTGTISQGQNTLKNLFISPFLLWQRKSGNPDLFMWDCRLVNEMVSYGLTTIPLMQGTIFIF